MEDYDWPGNVRELINTMERSVLLAGGNEIGLADLPAPSTVPARRRTENRLGSLPGSSNSLPQELLEKPLVDARNEVVSAFEFRYLTDLLTITGGRVGDAADRAKINERSLYDLMKRRGLRKENFRSRPRRR